MIKDLNFELSYIMLLANIITATIQKITITM